MKDKILGWLMRQWADQKRVTIAVIAAVNAIDEKWAVTERLQAAGIPIPTWIDEFSGWVAVAILAVASKYMSGKVGTPSVVKDA